MSSALTWAERNPVWMSRILWLASGIVALSLASGLTPTKPPGPVEGTVETGAGTVAYSLPRSAFVGRELVVLLEGPVPSGVGGTVRYRRVGEVSWQTARMSAQTFETLDRGRVKRIDGVGARLPALADKADAYEYTVTVDDGVSSPETLLGAAPVRATYRAPLSRTVALLALLVGYAAAAFSLRAGCEVLLPDGDWEWLAWSCAVLAALLAFAVMPLAGWLAEARAWSAAPVSWSWANNRALLLVAVWLAAALLRNRSGGARAGVLLAAVITAAVATLGGSERPVRLVVGAIGVRFSCAGTRKRIGLGATPRQGRRSMAHERSKSREPKVSRYIALFFAIWVGGGFVLGALLRAVGVEGAGVFAGAIMFGVGFVASITPFGRAQVRYHSGAHGAAHSEPDEQPGHGESADEDADAPGPVHTAASQPEAAKPVAAESTDGWLPDPTRRHELRYRGVNGWTDLVRDGNFSSNDPFDPSEALGA